MSRQTPEDKTPVCVFTASDSSEALAVCAALQAENIAAFTPPVSQYDDSAFLHVAGTVPIYVPAEQEEAARTLLQQPPLTAEELEEAAEQTSDTEQP